MTNETDEAFDSLEREIATKKAQKNASHPVVDVVKDGNHHHISLGTKYIGKFSQRDINSLVQWYPGKKGRMPNILNSIHTLLILLSPKATNNAIQISLGEYRIEIINELTFEQPQAIQVVPVPTLPSTIPTYPEMLTFFPPHQHHTFEVLICMVSTPSTVENPPWLSIVSPASVGKSFLLKLFNHPSISVFVDDFTENSLFPGKPNMEAAEVHSLLDQVNNRALILNDLSSVFSQRSEKINKFIGQLTTAYGGDYYKHSPGTGVEKHNTSFILIMAMTYEIIRRHRKYMNTIGNRILFEYLPRGGDHVFRREERKFDKDILQLQVCGLIKQLKEEPLLPIPEPIQHALATFVKYTVVLRTFLWAYRWSEVEGNTRLYHQLAHLIRSRARLHERAPLMEDLEFFKPLAWHTIDHQHNIIKIYNGTTLEGVSMKDYLRKLIEKGEHLRIIRKNVDDATCYEFIPEYEEYLKPMFDVDVKEEDLMEFKAKLDRIGMKE